MKDILLYFLTLTVIIAITSVCVVFFKDGTDESIAFLEKYGWEVEPEPIERESITIPEVFDSVYSAYNRLQLDAGLDLQKYAGKKAVRFTYTVLNYPEEISDPVRANVICVNGRPVGGDVMTVRLDGFIQPLSYLAQKAAEAASTE